MKQKRMPAPDKSKPPRERAHYELMPENTSLLLGIIEAATRQFNEHAIAAMLSMTTDAYQKEVCEVTHQNVSALMRASAGVAAGQRAVIYSALLAQALSEWRCEGADFPGQEMPNTSVCGSPPGASTQDSFVGGIS